MTGNANGGARGGRGLALAAGGARGAYQAGALLALADRGVRFTAVAGTSIGALNGAFYAQGDGSPAHLAALVRHWRAIPGMGLLRLDRSSLLSALGKLIAGRLPGAAVGAPFLGQYPGLFGGGEPLLQTDFGILDPGPIQELLDRWLDYGIICRSSVDLYVAVLPSTLTLVDIVTGPWRKPIYLRARDLGPDELRRALLAAAAIPFVFPAITVAGRPHSDAGLADPLPVRPLYERGLRCLTSIFLADNMIQNRLDYPGCALEQIRPSRDIAASWGSMLDFSSEHVERLIDLGFQDATLARAEVEGVCAQLAALGSLGEDNLELARALPSRGRSGRER